MKILQINSVCGIRSTGRICIDIAEALIAEGHSVRICYGREAVPEKYKKYSIRITNNWGCKVHAFLSRLTDRSGFYSKRAARRLIRLIEQYSPDVIHLHNLHGYYVDVKTLFTYLAKCKKKVIWTLHDCWGFTGHCAYFSVVGCQQWQNGCSRCVQKMRYPKSVFLDQSRRNYLEKKSLFTAVPDMTIVTPSKWLADLVRKSFLNCYDVCVINNGIDTDVFTYIESDFRDRYNLQDKKIVLGVSTLWDRLKGLGDFIEIAKGLDDSYQVVLVGLSNEQIQSLPSKILGIARTNNTKELAEIYSAADVFVNPTYEDNYPTVNLEAQSCGTPVITYKTGGSVESVPADQWVEQGDVQGMIDAIEKLVTFKSGECQNVNDKRKFVNEYMKLYLRKCQNEKNIDSVSVREQ